MFEKGEIRNDRNRPPFTKSSDSEPHRASSTILRRNDATGNHIAHLLCNWCQRKMDVWSETEEKCADWTSTNWMDVMFPMIRESDAVIDESLTSPFLAYRHHIPFIEPSLSTQLSGSSQKTQTFNRAGRVVVNAEVLQVVDLILIPKPTA
jgi:hypothetical protein